VVSADGLVPAYHGAEMPRQKMVKTYGRGSLLGILSLPVAFVMARAGMRGWEDSALQAMQKDAAAMVKRGYRVVSSEEYTVPTFGFVYYKVVYEMDAKTA
jgi:hypothetical protein